MIDNLGKTVTYAKLPTTLVACLCLVSSLLLTGSNGQKTHPVEVNALRSIKLSLTDEYEYLSNWKKGDPCTANWTGVICYNTTLDDGYFHIRELLLLNMNLSGSLSPELGRLSYVKILDFMWNNISGTIPKEIGNITTLELLLLNGNQLTGSLPDELGYLSNLDRIQIDQNQISGQIPQSFANLTKAKHFHMNNNSLSGQIPPELSRLPILVHLLLDNNNLSGYLPPELSELPNLLIFQLDNNNFNGSTIPSSYGNMSRLLKLSLRNCSLVGPIPNWSNLPDVAYIDLSLNNLSGPVPTGVLSENITTIDLSNNNLNGTIPPSFSKLPLLQKLSLANNSLIGSVPSVIWQNRTLNASERLILDFENNKLSNISGSLLIPPNVTIGLQGNPVCSNESLVQLCSPRGGIFDKTLNTTKDLNDCLPQSCPPPYDYAPSSPSIRCFCAAPLYIGYRLKSPGFSDFLPYYDAFKEYLTSGLDLNLYQLHIDSAVWQNGPRLRMHLEIFPVYVNNSVRIFNKSEVRRIQSLFSGWRIRDSKVFGPFELLNFTLSDVYRDEFPTPSPSGISKGALVGIILGTIAGTIALSAFVSLVILRLYIRKHHPSSRSHLSSRISVKIDGTKDFTYAEMATATNNFSESSMIGQGGYGKVYKGILKDGTVVAIKRAQEGSLQGEHEFLTEIELLSRLHHRNLVSLVGYCDEQGEQVRELCMHELLPESPKTQNVKVLASDHPFMHISVTRHPIQMLVYEFMSNGTLRDHLSGKFKVALNFSMRVRIALGAARGIHYLHAEANPPIFHRDIKATNILLDSKLTAKVADFGLSRLATMPELEGAVPAHVSTVVKGTPGYLDPEYFLTHQLTDKSDVYSLGVVFLELLTGLHPIFRGKNIVREVNTAYLSGMVFSIIDDKMGSYPSECVEKFLILALSCCKNETEERPSMAKVVRELENIWLMMPETEITESSSSSFVSEPAVKMASTTSIPYSSSSSSSIPSRRTTPFVSEDVSRSTDLVSGVIHTVEPR